MTSLLVSIIRAYQKWISPLFAPACRFQPSCSEYTAQAVLKYGVLKGMYLGFRRLLRCHPLSEGGLDPVP
ncbi:MAG: membrane protein insertion efficiency factor YidD [bacterium JZ-2024 1]